MIKGDIDFMDPWQRTRLLLKEDYKKIQELSVLVLGLGGVGSYVVEGLARLGVRKLILVDYDTIDRTNINRQIEALHSTIGLYKADILKERVQDIHPTCEIKVIKEKITPENIDLLFLEDIDFLVDACDTVPVKKEIMKRCVKMGKKFILSMGTANKIDPTKLKIMDLKDTNYDPLAKILRKEARKEKIDAKIPVVSSSEIPIKTFENQLGSISFVPSVAGLLITSYITLEVLK
jgi:tRNA A37 threonylcarbamoyladenosine dehydratase